MLSSINPNLLFDVRKYHLQAWQSYVDFKEQFMMHSISNNLMRGMEAGIYRADLNVRILARLRLEEVEMGFNPDIYHLIQISIEKCADGAIRPFHARHHHIQGTKTDTTIQEPRRWKTAIVNAP